MSQGEGGGRPSKFTPERCAAIVADIADAIPYEYAAEANGICEATLHSWLAEARRLREQGIENDLTKFLEDIKKAERARIKQHQDNINSKDEMWTTDAWMLERRWWKHYSRSAPILDFEARLKRMEEAGEKKDG